VNNQKNENNKTIATKGQVKKDESQKILAKRKDKAYAILISKAAFGDDRYRPTLNPRYGDVGTIDIKTSKDVIYSGYHIPGVGVSDFEKKEKQGHQSTLDRRRHVGYSELFGYIDFTKKEIRQYIDELKNYNPTIIEKIAIAQGKERRYIITDPLLKEFVAIFWNIFGDINLRMKETYVYGLWPKEKVGKNKFRSIKVMDMDGKNSTVYKSYMKWYKLLFGKYRFTRSHFSRLLRKKRSFEGLCRFKKYLERMLQKKDLKYCSRDDIINSYNKILEMQQESLKHARNLINSYDNNILSSYRILMMQENKFAIIRHIYDDLVKALLDLIYPTFLRKLYEKQKA
jgi:hypothetical protein